MSEVAVGTKFTTPYEKSNARCIALTAPDEYGEFLATDSEGVECIFCVDMILEIFE